MGRKTFEGRTIKGFEDQYKKTATILNDLEELKEKKNPKIVDCVSVFLIDSQYAEWGAKQLVNKLDQLIDTPGVKRINRYKYIKGQTLGRVIELIEQYSFKDKSSEGVQKSLVKKLMELNFLRRKYVHHLFSSATKGPDIIKESKKGIALCDGIHRNIYLLMLLQDKKMCIEANIKPEQLKKVVNIALS